MSRSLQNLPPAMLRALRAPTERTTNVSGKTTVLPFAIQQISYEDGQHCLLWIKDRPERGVIENPTLYILDANDPQSAFFMRFTAKDGREEQIGSPQDPLPFAIRQALTSKDGLTIMFVYEGSVTVNREVGQVLWATPQVTQEIS